MDIISALEAMAPGAIVRLSRHALRLLERSPGCMALLSGHDFNFVYANAAFARRMRPAGQAFFDAFPELAGQGVPALFDRVVARRQPYVGCGKRIGLGQGGALEWHVVDVTLQPVHGPSGKILGLLVHCYETGAPLHSTVLQVANRPAAPADGATSPRPPGQQRIAAALRDAIDHGGIEVHYQPQVDLVSGVICGVEALVRWTDPVMGPIPADTIVRTAEENGLIGPLGERVLGIACAQAQAWRRMGSPGLRVAVNLSARQVCMEDLERMVLDALDHTGLPPANLDLELTESVVMEDMAGAVSCFERLKRHGVQLSLDDFGTGYSSLAYLRLFPIDSLKIDRLFLDLVPNNVRAAGLVGTIIAAAHGLGMRVIAEGVEHEDQLRFLARSRCDEIQGYYFSRPLPPAELTAMLAARHVLPEPLRRQALHTPCILLVDSDPERRCALGTMAAQLLARSGRIVYASSAAEAIMTFGEVPDIVLAGPRLPDMAGEDFMRTAGQAWPAAARILLADLDDPACVLPPGQDVADAVIGWPAGRGVLLEHMRKILG